MRWIANHIGTKIHIVALSTGVANANDLGDCIGAKSCGIFNFPPIPLEMHLQGVNILNLEARLQPMANLTHTNIVKHANGKPALVFVPVGKLVRLTALDLVVYSNAKCGTKPLFLLGPWGEMETIISGIKEDGLKKTLADGVSCLHEGLSGLDQEAVLRLFVGENIQVLVASSSVFCGMQLAAHVVVVMGTECHNERKNAHIIYSGSELLQMMGHACRSKDSPEKCVVLCHSPRKEFYRQLLCEPFSVESHHCLHTEKVRGVVENKQDVEDYLTWTYMYQRLTKNPDYYNVQGCSHRQLSIKLSDG